MSFIAVLRISEKRHRLLIIKSRLLKSIVVDEAVVEDGSDALKETLREKGARYPLQGVIILFPFYHTISDFFTLPLKRSSDIARAVPFKMEDTLPLPLEEYLFGFRVIDRTEEGSRVIAAALSRAKAEEYFSLAEEAGVRVISLRPYFTEVAGYFQRKYISSERHSCLLYRESEYLQIACFKEKRLSELKRAKALEILLRDLPHDADFYIPTGMETALEQPRRVPIDEREVLTKAPTGSPLSIEFLPRPLVAEATITKVATVLLALAIVIHLLSGLLPYWRFHLALRDTEQRLSTLEQKALPLLDDSERFRRVSGQLKELTAVRERTFKGVVILRELTERVPLDAWLQYLKYEGDRVEIRGYAGDALETLKSLQGSAIFAEMKLLSPIVTRDEGEQFNIRLKVKR